MATFQTMAGIRELSHATLQSWNKFLTTLRAEDVSPYVGATSAAFVSLWDQFDLEGRFIAKESLDYIVIQLGVMLKEYLDDIVDMSSVEMLRDTQKHLDLLRSDWTPGNRLEKILGRSLTDNLVVAIQSLKELKAFLLNNAQFIADMSSGDVFNPLVGETLSVLFQTARRDGEGTEQLRLLTFECIGLMGAVDPDRCDIGVNDPRMIVLSNFTDETESIQFATHLISDLLVGAFRSTSDIKYQSYLAYSIQELLQFCQFTPAMVAGGNNTSVSVRARNRWAKLPKHVMETAAPLLEARFTLQDVSIPAINHPIYPGQSTYREWIQLWTTHLISRAAGPTAKTIFRVFRVAVRNKDVVVAHHLLPHLVLNILIAGNEKDSEHIRIELLAVLEDQVKLNSLSTPDKKLLSAQVCNRSPKSCTSLTAIARLSS